MRAPGFSRDDDGLLALANDEFARLGLERMISGRGCARCSTGCSESAPAETDRPSLRTPSTSVSAPAPNSRLAARWTAGHGHGPPEPGPGLGRGLARGNAAKPAAPIITNHRERIPRVESAKPGPSDAYLGQRSANVDESRRRRNAMLRAGERLPSPSERRPSTRPRSRSTTPPSSRPTTMISARERGTLHRHLGRVRAREHSWHGRFPDRARGNHRVRACPSESPGSAAAHVHS